MSPLPEKLYTAEQTRSLDTVAIEDRGVEGYTLMQRAGAATFQVLRARWPHARRISVLCGPGNNGGDGFVVGNLALQAHLEVDLYLVGDAKRLKGDAATAAKDFQAQGGEILSAGKFRGEDCEVIVDALLGTGLERPVEGVFAELIHAANAATAGRVAVDIPSGLSADTGAVLGSAVRADTTVTFIGVKRGLLTGSGPDCTGDLVFDDLGVPDDIYDEVPFSARRVTQAWVASRLPPRARGAHKGHFGHVLCLGGDYGMGGAVRLCAEAAVRAGAGLVSAGTRPEHVSAVIGGCPVVMARAAEDQDVLDALIARASVIAVGPGLGQSEWGTQLLEKAVASRLPLVVDADALTPHPGEAARLLNTDVADVQQDRFAAARRIADNYGGVCVLKGCGTVVAGADSSLWLCDKGNPGMASGGMGDVLTGAIAGLRAQGLSLTEAAVAGTWLHAEAADRATVDGERGLAATDVLAQLRTVANPDA
jgi:hydroxyethylthiazole kinase-like uncharacterized protein yjeF